MMKICFAVDSLSNGGAERVVSTISNQLVLLGHEVSIIIVSSSDSSPFYNLDKLIKIYCLNSSKKTKNLSRIKLYSNLLKNICPDILIAFLPHVCIYSFFASKKAKIPLIVSERNDPKRMSVLKKVLCKYVFRHSNACVFQTYDAMNWYKLNKTKKMVIPNPVSLGPNISGVPQRNERVILYVGRLEPQKNVRLLIDAFDALYKNNSELLLKIYGKGSEEKQLKEYAETLPSKKNIKFAGVSNNWHSAERDANTFVLTSNYEGMPNALEEALCLGIQCVATNCPIGGSKYLMSLFGYDNLIVKSNCKDDLVEKISLSTKDDFRDIDLINNNRLKLSPECICKAWLDLIHDVIDRKSKKTTLNQKRK